MPRTAKSNTTPLRRYLTRVTLGGSLCMLFVTGTMSPVTTAFLLDLGATEFQFGLLGGIPMILLGLQFFGAYLSGRLRFRKPLFIIACIAGRLMFVPAAMLPYLLPDLQGTTLVGIYIVLVSVYVGLNNLVTPMWFSWMADLVPPRILNRYWGQRQRMLSIVWAAAYLAVAVFSFFADTMPTRVAFPIIAMPAVLAGVIDVLMFIWVKEPKNVLQTHRSWVELLMEPLRDAQFRSIVRFGCAFSFAGMMAAAFMQVYVRDKLGLPLWQMNIMWCASGIGGAVVSRLLGRLADAHGQRPVLVTSIIFKPLVCIVFIAATPQNAFWLIGSYFVFDSMLNAGYMLGINGYALRMAPRENRSMFVAAVTALSGIAAGLGAISGGKLLRMTQDVTWIMLDREWHHYHILFATSFALRLCVIPMALAIKEPKSTSPFELILRFRGIWPWRMMTYPLGLYRRYSERQEPRNEERP